MKTYFKFLLLAFFTLVLISCSKIIPPHTAVKCKLNYDSCMIENTFEGPLRSHEICLSERLPVCRNLP